MKKHLVFFGVVCMLVFIGLTGCTTPDNTTKPYLYQWIALTEVQQYGSPSMDAPGFQPQLLGVQRYKITGEAQNVGTSTFQTVEVIFTFYDDQNNSVNTKSNSTVNLEGGTSWEFTVYYEKTEGFFSNVTRAELTLKINGEVKT